MRRPYTFENAYWIFFGYGIDWEPGRCDRCYARLNRTLKPPPEAINCWKLEIFFSNCTDVEAVKQYFTQAPVVIVVCADTRRPATRYGARGVHFYSLIDGAFAAMLILLTVVDEGLGCCFVGAFHDEQVSRVLGLPDAVRPIGIIPIGYPAEPAQKYRRLPLEQIVHQDRWGQRRAAN